MTDLQTRQSYLDEANLIESHLGHYEPDVIGDAVMAAQDWFDQNCFMFSEDVHNVLEILLDAAHSEFARSVADDLRTRAGFFCTSCDFDCMEGNEYYVMREELRTPKDEGMLCIGCREQLLGRALTNEDFNRCPLNDDELGWNTKSERLTNRLNN